MIATEARAGSTSEVARKRIALICDSLEDDFQAALVQAALTAAAAHGVDLLIIPGGKLLEPTGKNFVHALTPLWADGIIVAAQTIGHLATELELVALLEKLRPVPTVTLGEVRGADCCLAIDNETAAYALTRHLVQQHRHRRFAYVSGPAGTLEALERERGVERALRESCLTVPERLRLAGDFTWEGGRAAVRTLLDVRGVALQEIDALICANDATAIGACLELEARGVCVPHDLAVVGFDDTGLARHLPAPLTTVRQPLRELLFDATRLLVEAFATGQLAHGCHRYGAEPVHRRSCGCPRMPNLPHPSNSPNTTRRGRAAIEVMENALRAELDEGFVAVLDGIGRTWLGDLLGALLEQLQIQGTGFYDTLEALCFRLLAARKPSDAWQHTLLSIRRHVARSALSDPEELADLDRFIDGAMRLTSELTASTLMRQREELLEHLRVLSDATAGLLAAPDLGTIANVTRVSFPKLGVERGLIGVFTSDVGSPLSMTTLSAFGMDDDRLDVSSPGDLIQHSLLRGRSWVIEPLGSAARPLGLAVLQCGLSHVSWYERLRDALTAAINGAQLIQQVQRLAVTDALTGLHNRRYLSERIRQELDTGRRRARPLSLLVLDLDGFKALNDERGHDEGDRALIEAGESIKRCLRDTDALARFGGDEFVAVLPGATAEQALAIAHHVLLGVPPALRDALAAPLTCSIGIATVEDASGTREAELFRLADQALLAAKRAGKNRVMHARELPA